MHHMMPPDAPGTRRRLSSLVLDASGAVLRAERFLILVLMFRPSGLLGRPEVEKV